MEITTEKNITGRTVRAEKDDIVISVSQNVDPRTRKLEEPYMFIYCEHGLDVQDARIFTDTLVKLAGISQSWYGDTGMDVETMPRSEND